MKINLCTDFATRYNTVTPVYANPFTHDSPNALSCLFMVFEQNKCDKFDRSHPVMLYQYNSILVSL